MNNLEIQCSSCGNRQKISLSRTGMLSKIEKVIDSGWNNCGGVLYCPECTRTWADRNGDRPMGGKVNTLNIIWRMAFDYMCGDDHD